MDLTRRDMFKLGALGVVGAAGAGQLPWSSVIEAQTVGLLSQGDLPQPFRTSFVRPPYWQVHANPEPRNASSQLVRLTPVRS